MKHTLSALSFLLKKNNTIELFSTYALLIQLNHFLLLQNGYNFNILGPTPWKLKSTCLNLLQITFPSFGHSMNLLIPVLCRKYHYPNKWYTYFYICILRSVSSCTKTNYPDIPYYLILIWIWIAAYGCCCSDISK